MRSYLKNLLSVFIIAIFAVLGGGSSSGEFLSGIIIICVIMLVIAFNIFYNIKLEKEKTERALKERLEKERIEKEEMVSWYERYKIINGTPDKTIFIKNKKEHAILVHENSKKIFILGTTYAFDDILSCTYQDDPSIVKGKVTAVTKTDSGSAMGRAIAGDIVAGPVGAMIGGSTATKVTEFFQDDDKFKHNFTVVINIDNIVNPIVRINTGPDASLTNDIVGLINVIISRR